jgi:homoserine O-acetyltransferase
MVVDRLDSVMTPTARRKLHPSVSSLSRHALAAILLIAAARSPVLAAQPAAAPAQKQAAKQPIPAQQFADLGNCSLDSGKEITGCKLGYRTWGKLNADHSNAILFPTWFTGKSGELDGSIGPDKFADPTKYFIIAVDAFGNGVSSSPSNSKTQPRMSFPAFTTHDMVRAEYRLATEELHLTHLHAVMGISMGGMQTFEWMVDFPDFMDYAVPIVGSTRLTSFDLLLWHGEEDAVRADPAWMQGNYTKTPPMLQVAILHDMNLSTPAHYAHEVSRDSFAARYKTYRTEGATEFDANDRIYQLEAMLHHDVAHGSSLEDAAQRVHAKVLVVSSQQDHMVNPAPAQEFARLLHAKTVVLTSDCGHMAPGCEAATLAPQIRAFLDGQ